MLVDLPHLAREDAVVQLLAAIFTRSDAPASPVRLAEGVYKLTHWSFGDTLKANRLLKSEYPFDVEAYVPGFHSLPDEERETTAINFYQDWEKRPSAIGVCDDWRQIIKRWPEIVTSDRRFVIAVVKVTKISQPAVGGWRWHKWGEYIGVKNPQHEYLYDEGLNIQEVFTFHIYEVV